ncbi:hypothetical protein A2803_02215 [Candidatus Woesebacteria bacterium RIFCSPHIGHO2_01_FULL_44_21]|uniref:Uncharacterized protein n=1 Tax=Candidatus Woesebacteria bacterium RIFCSPHIGHO2_01_FULL_44_21 TaxID=1802503 RepID=A0A1F7YXS1_9BACT|nr:MAG: hypothetical protein A2803_02215 [Candidatus Woesebacteria bacterium RIFCSPHIGHO2_01_FULL_44_21]
MSQIVIKNEMLDEFARLADLLQEASAVARKISRRKSADDFWLKSEKLQNMFKSLSEKKLNSLISDSVVKVRSSETRS